MIVAAVATTAGCAQAEPDAPEPLSVTAAGGVYLDAVCPVNAAWDQVDLEVDRLRLGLQRGETSTKGFVASLKKLEAASEKAAKRLAKNENAWPLEAEDAIVAVKDTLLSDATQAARAAKLSAKQAVDHTWKGSEEIAQSAAEARASLGLPADPQLACAQRVEQQRVEQERAKQERAKQDENDKKESRD
jgi:hypothetical protein